MTEKKPVDRTNEEKVASAELLKAQADKAKAEARKIKAEALKAEYEASGSRLTKEKLQRDRNKELAADAHHQLYRFIGGVTSEAVKTAMTELTAWS